MTDNTMPAASGLELIRDIFEGEGYKSLGFSADMKMIQYPRAAIRDHLKVVRGLNGQSDDLRELAVAAAHIGYELGQADARRSIGADQSRDLNSVREALSNFAQVDGLAEIQPYRVDEPSPSALEVAYRAYARGQIDAVIQQVAESDPELREYYDIAVLSASELGLDWNTTRSEATLYEVERRIAEAEISGDLESRSLRDTADLDDDELRTLVRERFYVIALEAEAKMIAQARLQDAVRAHALEADTEEDRLAADQALKVARSGYATRAGALLHSERVSAKRDVRVSRRAERMVAERVAYAPIDQTTLMTIDAERRQKNLASRNQKSQAKRFGRRLA